MRRGALHAALAFAALGALSCTKAARSPAAASKPPLRNDAPATVTARQRLVSALRAIPRPQPVLAALPLATQERLRQRFAALDTEHQAALHSDDSALVEVSPLLHLISGGSSPRALFALATTSAGSDELAASTSDAVALPEPVAASQSVVVRELAERAADNFLRDRAADAGVPGKATRLVARLVARAAITVGRRDIVRDALALLAEVEPSADNRLEYAEELARSGELARAAQLVDDIAGDKRHPARPGAVATVAASIAAARIASAGSAVDQKGRLEQARAWLRLGRSGEARAILERDGANRSPRLDLAAAWSQAQIDNAECPGLPRDVGNAALCAATFEASQSVKQARALLEVAWASGEGRDETAVETFVALDILLPWLHSSAADSSRGALGSAETAARIAELRAKVSEVAAVQPQLQGLLLFLETVRVGGTDSAAIGPAEGTDLAARALSLAATDSSRFAQAGVLAVAARLSHQRDVAPLIDALPPDRVLPQLRVPRVALEAWVAASTSAPARMDAARAALAGVMAEGRGSSLERARLVLSMTEADALLAGSERSYQMLSRVAGQLLSDNIPPDLALRAVLDAAGALAHAQRFEQAQKILSGASSAQLPADLQRARELLQLIRGYQAVLGVQGAAPTELPKARAELTSLGAEVKGEAAQVWFDLWAHELDAMQRDLSCAASKQKRCPAAEERRRSERNSLDGRLGASASAILVRGALPTGAFDAGFRFSNEAGLEPLVSFDPAFLAISLPRFSVQ